MPQLVNFIPGTASACRSLLKDISGQTTFTLFDRYGCARTLGPDEISELVSLIENQIGEKTPSKKTNRKPKKK